MSKKNVVAFDSHFKFANETPMQSNCRQRANGEFKLSWKLDSMPSRRKRTFEGMVFCEYQAQTDAHFSLGSIPSRSPVKMRVSVGQTTSNITGKGACKLVK